MTTTMSDVIAAQADEIISLRAEIRQLQAERDRAQARCLELAGRASALQGEVERLREDYVRACQTVAEMHAAAVGEVTEPIRGVVEDVEDVRLRAEKAEATVERVRLDRDQWRAAATGRERLEAEVEHWKVRAEANAEIDRRAGMLAGVEREHDEWKAQVEHVVTQGNAEVERLTRENQRLGRWVSDARRETRAVKRRVRARHIHQPPIHGYYDKTGFCRHCHTDWPCDTIRDLDEERP